MAKNLFREFLRNTDRILDIAEEMLEKHIGDEEVVEDNTELIAQKKAELEKLEKRLNKLISMRADNEITKEQFMNMKSEVDMQIASLQGQICELSPTEKVTESSDVPDYNERITLLRCALERYTNFDSDEDIPEAVIEAFVEKIVVNENSFDWYLHFSGDDETPKTCNVEGDKKAHKIELWGHLMRLRWWRAAQAAIKYHTVRSGDTLSKIAVKYHTTVRNICRLNGIKETTTLQIGRKLRVR